MEIIRQMWQSFATVDGSSWFSSSGWAHFCREDLRNFWILCQTNCQVLPDILHFGRVSPKKMSCQFQLSLQGILLDFSLTSLPLKCTEVGHNVQRVTKLLPDQQDMSGKIGNRSYCLFILDLNFFQKLINLSVNSCKKNVNFHECSWKTVRINIGKDDEWLWNRWNVKFYSQGK